MKRETAINYLADLFANGNAVTREEALISAGRPGNKNWFSFITSALKEYELFTKTYAANGTLEKIILTETGKKALTRTNQDTPKATSRSVTINSKLGELGKVVTLQYVSDIIEEFNRQNPSWEIDPIPKRIKGGRTTPR